MKHPTPSTARRGARWALTLLALLLPMLAPAQQVTYFHTDALGSTVMESNEAGAVTYSRDFRPYGEHVIGATKEGPGFTGHVTDAVTGLSYMQQRYYDPQIGRFLSTDLISANSNTGGNFNRYKYGNSNPYVFIDPDGRAESPAIMRALIPGQVTWDNAVTALENRHYGQAATLAGVAISEAALAVYTLGQSQTASVAGRAAVQEMIAVGAARQASSLAQASGATGGATTGLVTKTGEVFTGASARAGGPGVATHPLVQKALDSISPSLRSCYHGGCGEINTLSNSLNSGARVDGAIMATVRNGGDEAGKLMEGCPTCQRVAEKLEVRLVEP